MRRVSYVEILKWAVLLALPIYILCLRPETLAHEHSWCLFKNVFGRECYGCGMMKAVVAVAHLRFVLAWHYNRLIIVVAPLLAYCWGRAVWRSVRRMIR